MCTLQSNPEIQERYIEAHKSFKCVIQISLDVEGMEKTQKLSRPLILCERLRI